MALAGRTCGRPRLPLLLHKSVFLSTPLLQRLHPVLGVCRHRFLLRVMPCSISTELRDWFVACFPGIRPFLAEQHGHGPHPALPRTVKTQRTVVARSLHGMLQCVRAYAWGQDHSSSRYAGGETLATPIIAARVINAARSSSDRCSVPCGRSGMMRERTSALRSITRLATVFSHAHPNSRSTLRGSITTRER